MQFLLLLGAISCTLSDAVFRGLSTSSRSNHAVVLSELPHLKTSIATLPAALDWRNMNGSDFTSPNRNQHQPNHYCGACWAFSTTSMLSDRLAIAGGPAAFPKPMVAPQPLLTCGPSYERGCTDGGSANAAFKWIHENGIPDETCHNYEALDGKCDDSAMCQNCVPEKEPVGVLPAGNGTCYAMEPGQFPLYGIKEFGQILPQGNLSKPSVIEDMVFRMKAEVAARGPIVCQILCPNDNYMDNYNPFFPQKNQTRHSPFVLSDPTKKYGCPGEDWDNCVDHNIVVSGWGVGKDAFGSETPYWIIRNSWGSWWGEHGWFRVAMGTNTLGIESGCDWATPTLPNVWPKA